MIEAKLTELQAQLKHTARIFSTRECQMTALRKIIESESGFSRELWNRMGELGWTAMIFPEEYGGAEAGFSDLSVIYEEIGRVLVPSPFTTSVILSGLALMDGGSPEQKSDYIPGIASGETIFSLALTEPDRGWEPGPVTTQAIEDGDNYRINGGKFFIPFAHEADYLLCLASVNSHNGQAK
jgi:alkylation response protein AidB-like acyl-CoA dehydrogenase